MFASASVMVGAGQATVITRFGDLSRVLTKPGLAWKLPTPIESVIPVDLLLNTTSTGLQDVGTKDGLRILVQAYVAWQVPADPGRIRQFLRAVRNEPDEAARQLRSLVGSALQVTASSFELADLVDTDPKRQLLPAFETRLREQVSIGFRVLYAAIGLLAAAWVASNWRQVPADSQAVVLRFGRIVGVQQAGLTLSWPQPIGHVELVPGADRLLTLRTATTARTAGLQDVFTKANSAAVPEGVGSYLTGDGGVVLLSATITYRVEDGAAYYLARPHVKPALQRLYSASAVGVAATRALDNFLVARPDRVEAIRAPSVATENRQQAMRGDLVLAMNHRLAELATRGASLGVVVVRVDLDAALPPAAKIAFDGVLVAVQLAEQGIASARTEATRTLQAADRERDRLLTAAQANGEERIGEARNRTASIVAIEASMTSAGRPATLDQVYRDQLALLLHKVGRLTAVDANGGARVILPATPPGGAGK